MESAARPPSGDTIGSISGQFQSPRKLGPYELSEPIGRGAFATVFRAMHTSLQRRSAVKVLDPQRTNDEKYLERFRNEARLAARLNHPNIVSVYDFGTDGDYNWLGMELVEGYSLDEVLAAQGHYTEIVHAVDIIRQIAMALAYAAREGIIHRDIKPSNIMLTADGTAKLADLGLAKHPELSKSITAHGRGVGSAAYMAPECATPGAKVDVRADFYSLGTVFYKLITGIVPLTAGNPAKTAQMHREEDVPPPSLVTEGIPPEVDMVVGMMTARDPDQRYLDGKSLVADLLALSRGETPPVAGAALLHSQQEAQAAARAQAAAALPELAHAEAGPLEELVDEQSVSGRFRRTRRKTAPARRGGRGSTGRQRRPSTGRQLRSAGGRSPSTGRHRRPTGRAAAAEEEERLGGVASALLVMGIITVAVLAVLIVFQMLSRET